MCMYMVLGFEKNDTYNSHLANVARSGPISHTLAWAEVHISGLRVTFLTYSMDNTKLMCMAGLRFWCGFAAYFCD